MSVLEAIATADLYFSFFQYVNRNETKYTLLVNYTLSVGPEMTLYYHSAALECVIADIGKHSPDISWFASTALIRFSLNSVRTALGWGGELWGKPHPSLAHYR